jgi:hypothetical protein
MCGATYPDHVGSGAARARRRRARDPRAALLVDRACPRLSHHPSWSPLRKYVWHHTSFQLGSISMSLKNMRLPRTLIAVVAQPCRKHSRTHELGVEAHDLGVAGLLLECSLDKGCCNVLVSLRCPHKARVTLCRAHHPVCIRMSRHVLTHSI